jgi:signal peptidase I
MNRLPTPLKKTFAILSQIMFVFLMILGSGVIFHNLYFTPIKIVGASMQPTLQNNEFGIMDVHQNTLRSIKRFDIIVIQQNPSIDRYIIKRVLGLPNETLAFDVEGNLFIDEVEMEQSFYENDSYQRQTCAVSTYNGCDFPYVLDETSFFVSGDNRPSSLDSRIFGSIDRSMIIGKLIAIEGICTTGENGSSAGVDLSNCASRQYTWPRLYV